MSFTILLLCLLFGCIPPSIAWWRPKAWAFGVLLATGFMLFWIAIDVRLPLYAATSYFGAVAIGSLLAYRIYQKALLRDKHKATLARLAAFQKIDGAGSLTELDDDAYTDKHVP